MFSVLWCLLQSLRNLTGSGLRCAQLFQAKRLICPGGFPGKAGLMARRGRPLCSCRACVIARVIARVCARMCACLVVDSRAFTALSPR